MSAILPILVLIKTYSVSPFGGVRGYVVYKLENYSGERCSCSHDVGAEVAAGAAAPQVRDVHGGANCYKWI